MTTKKCVGDCKEEKELSEFSFRNDTNTYRNYCKICISELRKKRYNSNKNEILQSMKKYRELNKEIITIRKSKHYFTNKAHYQQYKTEYWHKNKDKINEYKRDYYQRIGYAKNRVRHQNRMKNDPAYKMMRTYRRRMSHVISKKNGTKTKHTDEMLGCSVENFLNWIEFQFEEGMSWENHGKVWHVDHIIPVAVFHFNNENHRNLCFSWKNMQPLFSLENKTKGSKIKLHYYFNSIVSLNRFIQIYELSQQEYQGINASLSWLRNHLGMVKNSK
jgi:hypothetical protein